MLVLRLAYGMPLPHQYGALKSGALRRSLGTDPVPAMRAAPYRLGQT